MIVIMSILVHHNKLPSLNAVKLAYEISLASSRIRKFMAQALHFAIATSSTVVTNEEIAKILLGNEGLAVDVVGLMRGSDGKSVRDIRTVTPCMFHVHAENEPCEYSKLVGL